MSKKVLIAGGSGLVGTNLTKLLQKKGYKVSILSRSKRESQNKLNYFQWDPYNNFIEKGALETDYIINLSGAGVADKPWTKSRKKELIDSRLLSTKIIHTELQKHGLKVKAYIGASAIGYYGDGGEEWQDENTSPTKDSFMSNLCRDWEQAHSLMKDQCDSLSIVRIGLVLSNKGGAYPKIRTPFKLGTSSYFGQGDQYYSWIHIDDLSSMIYYLMSKSKSGIYNGVSPNPYKNKKLVYSIKKALGIKALILPVPTFALKAAMGEMSNVLLNSNRISADKILNDGFEYSYPDLPEAVVALAEDTSI